MNRLLNILVLSCLYPPQVIGGYERSIADLAGLLHERGHCVRVLTSDNPQFATHYSSRYPSPPVDRGLRWAGEWQLSGAPQWFSPSDIAAVTAENVQFLTQHYQEFQPAVCLVGDMTLLHTDLLTHSLLSGVPIAHYVMNKHPGYVPELAPRSPLYQYITCSNWVAETLRQTGYPAATAVTIYPGAAVESFYQADLPPRDGLRIAYASLVMPYKGADVLVEALSLLQALGIEFTATIAGGTLFPEFVETLKAFVASEGMDDRITFPGVLSRQDLSQLYQTHNVLVFPSRFEEPFGISQVEAMAAGLTLVTSGTGGAKEIIEHGKDGLLFESENPFDLANVLTSLLEDPDHWSAIAHNGQQTAMTQFNHTRAVEQLESVLWNLVKAG